MSVEVSEQWIGKVAGWKMLKAGRSLWKARGVKSADWDADAGVFFGLMGWVDGGVCMSSKKMIVCVYLYRICALVLW